MAVLLLLLLSSANGSQAVWQDKDIFRVPLQHEETFSEFNSFSKKKFNPILHRLFQAGSKQGSPFL